MAMVSMKTENMDCCQPCEPNPYGYGLRINLTKDQVEALGITTPPAAGTVVNLQALATVTEVTQRVEEAGEAEAPEICLCLQITDLGMEAAAKRDGAKAMYPNSMMND